jgi:hypothetical protein
MARGKKAKRKPKPKPKPSISARGNDSHNKWSHASGGDDPQDFLGEKILFTFNPYGDASEPTDLHIRRLGAGKAGGNDADYWMSLIQSSYDAGSPASWGHQNGAVGKAKQTYSVVKALRIPYIVPDGEKRMMLDHLLIGYILPSNATLNAFASDWGNASPRKDVGVLGRLIMVDLYPKQTVPDWGVAWPSYQWGNDAQVFDPDPAPLTGYTQSERYWSVRGVDHRVEKSLLFTYTAVTANGPVRAQLLIGYEGSGGW